MNQRDYRKNTYGHKGQAKPAACPHCRQMFNSDAIAAGHAATCASARRIPDPRKPDPRKPGTLHEPNPPPLA